MRAADRLGAAALVLDLDQRRLAARQRPGFGLGHLVLNLHRLFSRSVSAITGRVSGAAKPDREDVQ